VVGAVGVEVHGEYGLLRSAVVDAAYRGQGVGAALTRDRIGWAQGRELRELYLLTTTAADFFARFGFQQAAREEAPPPIAASTEFASLCPATATVMRLPLRDEAAELKSVVREKYGAAAQRAASGEAASCCGTSSACCKDPITSDLYDALQTTGLPEEAVLASLGCGNPVALATLNEGETVLDLGSGGGIDVLLSARRVGATGKVYGLDMTDEMLSLARSNARAANATNVEFVKGDIEAIPLPDATVDVIISNCVINLAADKGKVLREAFRVLRPGGRFAVSDVVLRGELPAAVRRNLELWIGCVAGALSEEQYRELLIAAGFEDVSLEPTRIYGAADARQFMEGAGLPDGDFVQAVADRVMSAFVRGRKPAA
jgi:SAM-dependent methyltransferase